ncbi:LCP family protein [Phycicoccus sp. M110.8]|uniref:LCP family protein n=1 Tax=Phycicoccus sp. M110.8 TaxID=3075433 RepID=UPI0028FD5751|nr:LCP family protein [Phycicoccus sp. M110.8]MDU0312716.1 LCP family protein [Phycicoccus sp. M110.8]
MGQAGTAREHALSPARDRRRALTLLLATVLVPGSAQLAVGRRALGRLGLRAWLAWWAGAVLFGAALLVDRTSTLGLLTRDWFLTGLQALLWGSAVLWGVLIVDAWRLGRPRSIVLTARRWISVLTAGMLVTTTGGLVYAGTAVGAGRAALGDVFVGRTSMPPSHGRYNILLLGADTGRNRVGTRPDSIQVASVDARTGRTVTFGFSRDTENINFRPGSVMQRLMPEGWNCGDQCLLNALYTWADDHRALFPPGSGDPGVLATREAVEALSGLDIQYYVMIDLKGFQRMVDAVGGLDITVKRRTPMGGGSSPILGWIEPGRQHLDGRTALWYARSRTGSTNYERMARQRCVMTAMVQQLDPQTVILRFDELARASSGLLESDLPASELPFFAELALKAREQKITSVNFVPPLMKPWDYDATFVTGTVSRTISTSERGRATRTSGPSTRPGATSTPSVVPPTVDPKDAGGPAQQDDVAAQCA